MTEAKPRKILILKPKVEQLPEAVTTSIMTTEVISKDTTKPIQQQNEIVQTEITRVATENDKPKYKKVLPQIYVDILRQVRKRYAKAFPTVGKPMTVLAIGIKEELVAELNISIEDATLFCKIYCSRKIYRDTRVKGAKRYNLKGEVTGEVGQPRNIQKAEDLKL